MMNLSSRIAPGLMLLAFLTASCTSLSEGIRTNEELYHAVAEAMPGDTLVLANGTWSDVQLEIKAGGTAERPLVIMAEREGEVIFTGNSFIKLSGDHVEVRGIHFTEGFSGGRPVVSFRIGDQVANHSQLTSCAISYYNPDNRFIKSSWVELYGKHNRVDHCSFVGKLNAGVTLVVKLNGEENQENHHLIDHNYFGYRPRLGSNGGETMRVGTSTYSLTDSRTRIENNYFEHCSGEVEIISIKSGSNLVKGNTFYECEGTLTLRHGNNNVLTENVFIGNNVPYTGGIRIINEGHTISRNHFQELRGYRFRSALGILNGVPNSAINRYHQVRDTRIDSNVIVNCDLITFGLGTDNERTAVPENSSFNANVIYNPEASTLITELDDMSGITYSNNSFKIGTELRKKGFSSKDLQFEKNEDGLYACEGYQPVMSATRKNTGASWFKAKGGEDTAPRSYELSGNADIHKLLEQAAPGDEILISSDLVLERPVEISKDIRITGIGSKSQRPEIAYASNRSGAPLIIIKNGGELRLSGVRINGLAGNGIARVGIATQREPMIQHYNLFVDNCEFYNFSESRASAFQAFKSTFADSIVFRNSVFHTISGLGLNLKAENEDLGRYSAEYVILENCLFYNVMGSALDLYRGGNDESTTGPALRIDQCTFYNVENKELGSAVNLTGVQDISITNSIFSNSGKSGRVIRLEDQKWVLSHIENNNYHQCGRLESYYEGRFGRSWKLEPGFSSVKDHDFSLAAGSALLTKSPDGRQLGYRKEGIE